MRWSEPIARREDVPAVAHLAREVARSLDFSPARREHVAIVAAELAANAVKHAGGGTLELATHPEAGGSALLVVAYDHGPPIADFELAALDGCDGNGPVEPAAFYGRRGLATGLAAVTRLSDRCGCRSHASGKAMWAAFDGISPFPFRHHPVTRPPGGQSGEANVNEAKATYEQVDASGDSILSVIVGMGAFESTARRFLREGGVPEVKPGEWYPMSGWLAAFEEIAKKIGPRTLYYIGTKIPETAQLPPGIDDVPSALRAIDVGYHLNHRRDDRPMFDLATGQMAEGIGHYSLLSVDAASAHLRCDNPYPCDFDHGIIHGFATRFAPEPFLVRVTHTGKACRKNGDGACEYRVEWK